MAAEALPLHPQPSRASGLRKPGFRPARRRALVLLAILALPGGYGLVFWGRAQYLQSAHQQTLNTIQARGGHYAFHTAKAWPLHLGPVLHIDLADAEIDPPLIEAIAQLQGLERLDLRRSTATSADLLPLAGHRRLRYLQLDETAIDDEAMQTIGSLPNLRSLYLKDCAVSDVGLAHLRDTEWMRDLDLSGTQVTDAGMLDVGEMAYLVDLDVSQTTIGDPGMVALSGASRLRDLDANHTLLTDLGLIPLLELSQLEELEIAGTAITDIGVIAISRMPHLDEVDLSGTQVSGAGMRWLEHLQCLATLDVSRTEVTPSDTTRLSQTHNVQVVCHPE